MTDQKKMRQFPRYGARPDMLIIAVMIHEVADNMGLSPLLYQKHVEVYCTSSQWLEILASVSRKIYLDR